MGTSASTDQVTTFLQGITGSHGVRIALVMDESARSRVIEEIVEREVGSDAIVVHVRLCPKVSISLPPTIARPQCLHPSGLRTQPDQEHGNVGSLVASLRRLARLRPMLLIIEEMQMIVGEGRSLFASLLDSLANESLSILCLGTA